MLPVGALRHTSDGQDLAEFGCQIVWLEFAEMIAGLRETRRDISVILTKDDSVVTTLVL